MQPGTRFAYPGGMEGWVDLDDVMTPRPGVEVVTFRSRVRSPTTAPPRQLGLLILQMHSTVHMCVRSCTWTLVVTVRLRHHRMPIIVQNSSRNMKRLRLRVKHSSLHLSQLPSAMDRPLVVCNAILLYCYNFGILHSATPLRQFGTP